MSVSLDVTVLAAEREQDEVPVAGVPETPRRRRLDVHRSARLDLERLAVDLESGAPRVHEVELVLAFVEVVEPLGAGREDDAVRAECGDAQLTAELAKDARPELVERRDAIAHGLRGGAQECQDV